MIIGAHTMIHSTQPEADRRFLRDVLKLANVDAGGGFLIFGLQAAEAHMHPSDRNDVHELFLLCDDVAAFVAEMKRNNIATSALQDQGWGLLTQLTLPGGGKLGVYQPQHARPARAGAARTAGKSAKKPPRAKTITGKTRKKPRRR